MTVVKGELLYEGKAKKVYLTSDPAYYVVEFKDDATAFNGLKRGTIQNKGELNNKISAHFFTLLAEKGIVSHFVQLLNEREMLVKAVKIIAVEVVTRNIAAGSLAKRLGLEEGTELPFPVVEFYYKNDELGDPLINDDHALVLGLANREQLQAMRETARQVNDVLRRYLLERNVILVDFKLEFGMTATGELLLADEISPDTCRFWDATTREKLDKDRFRRDLGGVEEAYQEMWRRLAG